MPIGALTKSKNSAACVEYRLAALAVSIVLPPPTATNESNLPRAGSGRGLLKAGVGRLDDDVIEDLKIDCVPP